MERELSEWKETVKCARQEFYELNYFTTIQLLTLRRELSMEKASSDIAPNVLFLLQSISSQVTFSGVRSVVNNVVASAAATQFIPESTMQVDPTEDVNCTLQLDSANVASLMVSDSSEAVSGVKADNDMPNLRESEISDDQRDILEFVVRALDCSRFLVLKAFEECHGRVMDRYEYRDWCSDKLGEYKFEEESNPSDSEESDDDDAMSVSSSSDSMSEHKFVYSPGNPDFATIYCNLYTNY